MTRSAIVAWTSSVYFAEMAREFVRMKNMSFSSAKPAAMLSGDQSV